MHKKNYIQFAEMIAEHKTINTLAKKDEMYQFAIACIQLDLIRLFEEDNSSFDANIFNAYIDKRVKEILAENN